MLQLLYPYDLKALHHPWFGIWCKCNSCDCAVKAGILSSWCTVLCVVQEFLETVDAAAADFLTF